VSRSGPLSENWKVAFAIWVEEDPVATELAGTLSDGTVQAED
jgi:hypothetical protein